MAEARPPGRPGERAAGVQSDTYEAEGSHREAMQSDLLAVARWLTESAERRKRLKPIRSAKVLRPGIYYNAGTTMVDRLYAPQRVALGHRMFRITKDPAASAREVWRAVGNPDGGR
ncbi:Hypothetical Protein RradSPS_2570 [Rubrobacter radiotolerans]|uniref:Uncharacterized protein n=1 Tax=Rubrobacter radiotolerans TaxID=42256 RepID=A0A023X675_RUBRA|nr:hypothetical protein [Rubrobacter radiotolerans]AHY47853.1 Hypothetical Protein RradSPS_2570 [Rubrobacter radiotolerans]MDX5892492.1 hypothetical protein [Rubrobacter radiotolerans]SMC07783.1 hypothetical protein SAMN00767673_2643 [Rubrobacter radiotolerans DSM 5868]